MTNQVSCAPHPDRLRRRDRLKFKIFPRHGRLIAEDADAMGIAEIVLDSLSVGVALRTIWLPFALDCDVQRLACAFADKRCISENRRQDCR